MAKKRSMEALINAAQGNATDSTEVVSVPSVETKQPGTSQVETLVSSEVQKLPRWTTFEAVTARIRADQRTALTQTARQLNRAKPKNAERITENTLIRVAIDLLFAHQDELAGATEDELRASVFRNL